MALIVQKFGGTSVRDAERIDNVANIVTNAYKGSRYRRRFWLWL